MSYTIQTLKEACKGYRVQVFTQGRGPEGVLFYIIYKGDRVDELISKIREEDYQNVHFLSFDFFTKHHTRNRLGKETEIEYD